jgi:glutamine synthetase
MQIQGKLTTDALKEKVKSEEIETVIVAFTDHYGRLMGKRYDADFFLESVLDEGSHACDYLLTTDMPMEPVQGYDFANWERGYGDFHLVPDFNTLRRADWLEKSAMIFCDLESGANHEPVSVAPRTILKKQLQKLEAKGYQSFGASELEYYLFENDYRDANDKVSEKMVPTGWYIEDYHILQGSRIEYYTAAARRHLKKSGVPVENSKGEWGLGQHELNIRYSDTLEMADRHIVFKQCLKELADQLGISVTFMAKFHQGRAGSSCHLHISLRNGDKNIFTGDEEYGPVKASKKFGWFLGGWIKYVPDVMVFYAPTINSYKRYVDESWAPTRLAWSYDNRTAGFRVVGSGENLRIECRIPGADCNPYLAFAASIASGLKGIEEKIDPPECFVGDVYSAKDLPHVPKNLHQSLRHFSSSKFAEEMFGREVVDHYSHFYKKEIQAFDSAVTDWEKKRYFEQI